MSASEVRVGIGARGGVGRATAPTLRGRMRDFFALDDVFVRVPAADASRKDAVLTAILFALSALGLELARSAGVLSPHPAWAEYLGTLAMAAPIIVRRRWPVVVAVSSSLAFFVVGLSMPDVAAQLSVQAVYFFALFSSMAWAPSRRVVVGAMGGVLLLMFGWLTVQYSVGSAIDTMRAQMGTPTSSGAFGPVAATIVYSFLVNIAFFGGAVLGGQGAWRAARSRARLADQASTLQAQATTLRQHTVVQERLRIARELHDVVAHHVSVMGVQAAAARRVLDRDPGAASAALASVESSAREAVTEMRALLGTLRQGEPEDGATARGRSPEPGVEAIADLVTQLCDPTFTVTYAVVESTPGAAASISPAAGLTLYRTVQEAVSNVRRHSTATRAAVVLRVDTHAGRGGFAEVEIVDDGRPRTGTSGSGLGLLGMRERVASLDGALEIGPRVTGGFRVRVRLPLVGDAGPATASGTDSGTTSGTT
ncbi:MAG: sensor histidine kinase, partial [Lapillicoccus sp.]